MAVAQRLFGLESVEITPNGMLYNVKGESSGIGGLKTMARDFDILK